MKEMGTYLQYSSLPRDHNFSLVLVNFHQPELRNLCPPGDRQEASINCARACREFEEGSYVNSARLFRRQAHYRNRIAFLYPPERNLHFSQGRCKQRIISSYSLGSIVAEANPCFICFSRPRLYILLAIFFHCSFKNPRSSGMVCSTGQPFNSQIRQL